MIPRTMASVESDGPTGFSQVFVASVETQLDLRRRDPMDSRLRRRFIRDPIPETCASRATNPAVAGLTPRARIKLIFSIPLVEIDFKNYLLVKYMSNEKQKDIIYDVC
jgi:hypothetical protein